MEQKGGAAMRRWTEIGKDLLIVILVAALLTLTLLALPERTLTSSPVLSAALTLFMWLSSRLRAFSGSIRRS